MRAGGPAAAAPRQVASIRGPGIDAGSKKPYEKTAWSSPGTRSWVMPIVDGSIPSRTGSGYPAPFDEPCRERRVEKLGDAGGLTQFGVSRVTLPPGAWSSQRHHHSAEDELVYVLQGHPTFIDDNGERQLAPGDVTVHPASDGNAHHMVNRTGSDVVFLVVGTRRPESDTATYPDIDLHLPANGTAARVYRRKNGERY